MDHGNRLAHQWQRRRQPFEGLGIARNREMARPAPRGHPQVGQVHGQPLLQLAGPAGGDQGRPWRAAADVGQQAGAVWLRTCTDERRRRSPRSACRANRGDEDETPVHRRAGLA